MTRASRFLIGLVTCFATHAAFPGPRQSCDNDQIHHARVGGDVVAHHPGVHQWFGGARSSDQLLHTQPLVPTQLRAQNFRKAA